MEYVYYFLEKILFAIAARLLFKGLARLKDYCWRWW